MITIRADIREARSGIPDLLASTYGVKIETVPLAVGDYHLGGSPLRVVERKTAPDMVSSVSDQRLFAQAEALVSSGVAPLIVLEGDWTRVEMRMRPQGHSLAR